MTAPDPRRAAVEAVLRKHLNYFFPEKHAHNTFVDDLLALPPAPVSREELDKIFAEFFQAKYPGLPGDPPAMYNLSQLAELVMAWAQGQGELKVWCAHMEWKPDGEFWVFRPDKDLGPRAYPDVYPVWDRCPVQGCGARRPG